MKKIAIITLYGNNNFGNKLQNYASQLILNKLGFYVVTIRNKISFKNIKENSIYKLKSFIKNIINMKYYKKNRLRENRFKEFNKYINYTKQIIDVNKVPKNLDNEFDYFIYGSDQVWSPYAGGGSDLYLGTFSKKNKNISFSSSFGVYSINNRYIDKYISCLNNFKYISVREDAGRDIIKKLSNIDADVLIDPTMLLTSDEWDKLCLKPAMKIDNKKYILNYFLGELSFTRKKEIDLVAEINNCEIINILDKNSPFYECGPSEFLWLEKNAFLICTDSFHSSVFALLYDRPFIVFDRENIKDSMNSRLDTLISKFKLKNRRFEGKITEENLNHDYTEAYKILEKERKKSEDFLKKALDIND